MSLRVTLMLALALFCASPAQACYADYRAKMDNPLRLHYGVIDLPDTACTPETARPIITERLAAAGWTLLQIITIFEAEDLPGRRADAGSYFLRF